MIGKRVLHRKLRSNGFAALVAICVFFVAGVFIEHQNQKVFEQNARIQVGEQLSIVRAKLEGTINANIQLVRGLVAVLETEPDMDQARFEEIAAGLVSERSQLRNIAAAPDLVIRLMYPREGNEEAIGLDYRSVPAQREAALRVKQSGDVVLAGPVDLVQGGKGFVGRYPVFTNGEEGRRFWGLVAGVIDVERLYRQSGLYADLPIRIAISGGDAAAGADGVFFGDAGILESRPETTKVHFPSGSWQLAAVPEDGWPLRPDNTTLIRFSLVLASALVVIPMMISGRIADERQRHVTQLRHREDELQRLSQRLELALDASGIGIWEFDTESGELYWDERMRELYGLAPDAAVTGYDVWHAALHPDDVDEAEAEFRRVLDGKEHYESEFRVVAKGQGVRHIRAIGAAYIHSGGSRRIVGVNWDVSADVEMSDGIRRARDLAEARNIALEQARALMEHNAYHDPLTGLPNRRFLDGILSGQRPVGGEIAALLHIDLDRFKQINDTLGHAAGDRMLQHAAGVLKANLAEGDIVARIGGDEFVVVVGEPRAADDLIAFAQAIIEQMRRPLRHGAQECRTGVSIGIALADTDEMDRRRLLVNADIALYEAKNRGRNRYEFFNQNLQTAVVECKRLADELIVALERDEFVPYFQPQFDVSGTRVIGAEVLVRWDHPRRGLLLPAAFLKSAEEINLVSAIDRRILEKAMLQFYRWRSADIGIRRLSVNVSSDRLHDPNLIESLSGLSFKPGELAFELLESTYLDEGSEVALSNVIGLKEMGIDIEIDDFGTGYASIVSLLKLKPRRLKIDREIILPLTASPGQRQLVASIIEIGRSLQIEAIAEGVETMEHARILRRLGCYGLQGYAFARPMSANDLTEFMAGRSDVGAAEA